MMKKTTGTNNQWRSIGNVELLKQYKTVFLCSRRTPASVVLKCYDWAIEQRDIGNCIISGFHSPLEKDVLHFLLKGTQPLVVALARGLKKRLEPELHKPLDEGRLLLVSPFDENITRVTSKTSSERNKLMLEIGDSIVIGYASKGGSLEKVIQGFSNGDGKEFVYLHSEFNNL